MIGTTLRTVLALTALGITAVVLASTPAKAQNQNMEVIHHPNYDKNVFMPFVPAIKIKSGKILWDRELFRQDGSKTEAVHQKAGLVFPAVLIEGAPQAEVAVPRKEGVGQPVQDGLTALQTSIDVASLAPNAGAGRAAKPASKRPAARAVPRRGSTTACSCWIAGACKRSTAWRGSKARSTRRSTTKTTEPS